MKLCLISLILFSNLSLAFSQDVTGDNELQFRDLALQTVRAMFVDNGINFVVKNYSARETERQDIFEVWEVTVVTRGQSHAQIYRVDINKYQPRATGNTLQPTLMISANWHREIDVNLVDQGNYVRCQELRQELHYGIMAGFAEGTVIAPDRADEIRTILEQTCD